MASGKIFVISAPSGAGKTTLLKKIMTSLSGLVFSVSHTTRVPRAGEEDGKDYHFIDIARFEEMIRDSSFLEYAKVHGNYYGTSRECVENQLADGLDVVLDIDVQGADILRAAALPNAAYIFIAPPSMTELERRLRERGTESEERLATRLANAKQEVAAAGTYDYVLVNDSLADATELLAAIVLAERARSRRRKDGKPVGDICP